MESSVNKLPEVVVSELCADYYALNVTVFSFSGMDHVSFGVRHCIRY